MTDQDTVENLTEFLSEALDNWIEKNGGAANCNAQDIMNALGMLMLEIINECDDPLIRANMVILTGELIFSNSEVTQAQYAAAQEELRLMRASDHEPGSA